MSNITFEDIKNNNYDKWYKPKDNETYEEWAINNLKKVVNVDKEFIPIPTAPPIIK